MLLPEQAAPRSTYDAIVIGSGAGGGTAALRLSQRGLKVLLVERGGFLGPVDRKPGDPVGHLLTEIHGPRDKPLHYIGGQTKFYGSALYRFRVSDFQEVVHQAGRSPAWPISYDALEPYYAQAEEIYRVHGSDEGDRSCPPRSTPFPHPPLPHAPLVGEVVTKLQNTGTPVSPIPRGIDFGPGRPCVLCSTCDQYYCSLDAKMDTEVAAVRPAMASGNLTIATDTDCAKVLTGSDGTRVTGVVLVRHGEEMVVEAPAVVVAAGLPGSALLLRRSRTDRHPEGLGNQGGALGRYLAGHSTGMLFVMTGWSTVPAMHNKTVAINHFYEGGEGWGFPLGVIQVAGQMPFWDEASRWMRPIAKIVGQHSLMCFYMSEALPTRDSGYAFDGDSLGAKTDPDFNMQTFRRLREVAVTLFRKAGYSVIAKKREPYLWHETGTARMGADPGTSVVDADLQVHGIDGLYVADASVLPTAGAVNTGLTIMALALRCGDHIADRLARRGDTDTAAAFPRGGEERRASA